MRIIICDDNVSFAQQAATLIQTHIPESSQIEIVTDSALLKEIEQGNLADLYFLDIDMPSVNGMELAKKICENDDKKIIIFLTAFEQYVYQSFKVNAFRYIRKNYFEQEISEALQAASEQFYKQKTTHVFKTLRGKIKISLCDIGYIQKVDREIFLHKTNGEIIKIQGTITQIGSELNSFNFVQPNSGCVVNPAYIVGLLDTVAILEDNVKLPISRLRLKMLRKTINSYWKDAL